MLFKPHRGKNAVKVEYDGYRLPTGLREAAGVAEAGACHRQQPPPPELSMSASRQGSEMVLSFVNPRHDIDMDVECTLRGVSAKQGRAQILHDTDINAFNSFDNPNRIVIKSHQVAPEGDRVKITLPALSVATVTLQVG